MKSEVEQLGIKFDPSVKGMKSLDKAVFDTKVTLPCVVVDATELAKILYMLKPYLFKIRKLNSVMDYNDACLVTNSVGLNEIDTKPQDTIATDNKEYNVEGHKVKYNYDKKVILLNPKVIQKFEDFGEFNVKVLENAKLTAKDFTHAEVLLTYDNFSAEDILKAILPDNVAMSSFTSVGHIVHCNLREELIEHKFIIGRVLLDKVPSCETVVNKAHAIDNTYRNFQMELLAGKDCMVTMHKENGCTFKMDFSKVYWNSRLSTEHERVTKEVREGDLVLDVFAGVGPFSIPAARRGAIVAANDLNPDSYAWLQASIRLNERQVKTPISATQKDARDFLQTDARAHLVRWSQSEGNSTGGTAVARVIMNLPATAVEYVRYLKVLTREEFGKLSRPPVLYLYCFLPKMDLETKKKIKCVQAAKELFERNQLPFDASKMKFHFVRDVAPNKDMYKIVVQLGEEYLILNN
ncbi:hypothetical protein M8J76_004638 [Diaphorina citri]|nr:hypothetical protein M8J76_004638 [Diaphorina citri]